MSPVLARTGPTGRVSRSLPYALQRLEHAHPVLRPARAKLQAIKQELRRSMHQPIPQQGRWLQQVVTGYFNYHAVPTNGPTLIAFLFHVTNLWRRTLRQRSQKDWTTWERIKRLADDWLPKPRILHPWPESRFAVRHPRWEPYARIGPVRI